MLRLEKVVLRSICRRPRQQPLRQRMLCKEEMQEALDRFGDSPETVELIPRFLKLVFG